MRVDILVGNIGSGKSTIARKLMNQHGSTIVSMDNLQASLSCGEYGRYDHSKKSVYQAVEEAAIKESLKNGISVCIDRTNMDLARRERFISIANEYTDEIRCYDFGPGNFKELGRRISKNRDIDSIVWSKVFEHMKESYVKPSVVEGFKEIIKPPKKFRIHAFDFDGTLVHNDFPKIGDIIPSTVDELIELYQNLENIIIIWTCRNDDVQHEMRAFLIKNKIPFDFVNENPIVNFGSNKIFAHHYYDDRNQILDKNE